MSEVFPAVSAGLAAIAAIASWASVLQTRRERIKATEPILSIVPSLAGDGSVELELANYGGPAAAVSFGVIVDNAIVSGRPAPGGTFANGERRRVRLTLVGQPGTPAWAVIAGYDMAGSSLYVRFSDQKSERRPMRGRNAETRPSDRDLLRHFTDRPLVENKNAVAGITILDR